MKQTKVTEWIISGNPEQYNIVDAFHNLHRVDWAQKANMTAGDIVYIYVSGNVKAIKFKSGEEEYNNLYTEQGCVVIDILCKCEINEYCGNINPQLIIQDYEIVSYQDYFF